ncbi:MAG: ScyD/ScyE family protein [Steroidobacteraceae bacterium]
MRLFSAASIALAGIGSLALAGVAFAQSPEVVTNGLDNPRGLAFAPSGALYVTEAGRGGNDTCVVDDTTGETRCFGRSGSITRLWKGQQSRVAEGFESRGAYVTLGLGGDRQFQEALGGQYSGSLAHMAASGKWKVVADIVQHEIDGNPAGGAVDSNPFGVLAEPGSRL